MKSRTWSLNTRFLHFGMVATVTAQLFISVVMEEPGDDGGFIGNLAYQLHELIGLTALGIVALHWIWSLVSQSDGKLSHLFPWFGENRQRVKTEIKQAFYGDFPDSSKPGGLAGLIHGLGFLAVSGAAVTGMLIFLTFPASGDPGLIGDIAEEMHEGMATLVWAYWLGHGSAAILHHLAGHDTLKQMFRFNNRYSPNDDTENAGSNNVIKH